MVKREPKDQRVSFRFSKTARDMLRQLAQLEGVSDSSFLERLIRREAMAKLAETTKFPAEVLDFFVRQASVVNLSTEVSDEE